MKIGIIDSGVGGLSIYRRLKEKFPHQGVLYFADQAFMPYGEKDKKTLLLRGVGIISFLLERRVTHVILGCHTLDTNCGIYLQELFPVPFFHISESAFEMAKMYSKVGILATKSTIQSDYFQKKLQDQVAFSLACSFFGVMVEKGEIEMGHVKAMMQEIPDQKVPLLLACTHYPFLEAAMKTYLPSNAVLLDPATHLVEKISSYENSHQDEFYTTGTPEEFEKVGKTLLDRKLSSPFFVKSLYSSVNLKFCGK